MEVDLQSCGTLFSLLPSDIKCQKKYVESLFRFPLVCSEFYALYFFIFWGFFIALHSFPLYGWLGNLNIMECLLVPIILTYFMPPFWGLHFDKLCFNCLICHLWGTEDPLTEEVFLLPARLLPVQLGSWDCWEMGWDVLCWSWVRAQGPWGGFILLISTCWSLCQPVWAATVLCWFDSRDVRTRATIRPLLAQT